MKKLLQKTTAVLVSAALAVTCALPVFAEQPTEGVTKDENVFLILNPDGSVSEQIVSDWLHSDTGFDAAADRSTLSGITNLKSDVLPAQDGENLTWTTEDNDIYYQGTTTQTPPVTVDITYTLDGRSITADALAGKSGHLVMRLALTNNEGQEMEIAGSRRKVYTPFFTVAAATLPTGSYTNIAAQHGTVQTDAKTQLVCFLAMPGMAETFGGLLPEALSGLEDYMLDELVIEADVKDCTPPAFMLAAATSMDQLTSELDVPDLSGQMSQLEDATAQLQSGAATLHEATGTLQSKMDEFAASYATFDTGLDNALSGAQQVQSGAQNLLDGAKSLDNGTQQLADGTQQLNNGAQQLAGRLNGTLVPALEGAAAQQAALQQQMDALADQLGHVQLPDVDALKKQLGAGVGQVFDGAAQGAAKAAAQSVGDAVKSGALQAADAAVAQAAPAAAQGVASTAAQDVSSALAAVLQPYVDSGKMTSDEMNAVIAEAAGAAQGAAAKVDAAGMVQGAVDKAVTGNVTVDADAAAGQIVAAMAPEKEAAVNQVTAALNGLDTAALKAMLLQFQQLSGDAQTMMGSVKSLTDALYNADAPSDQNTVVGAAGALAAGAQSAQDGAASLRDGAAQLTAGAAQLSNGASSLSAGLTQLSGASKTVRGAIGQFRTGAGSLNDGAAQLQDGLDTYASQAIGKLTELAGSADTSALQDVLKALETRAQSYTSYTGSADGVRANVKFVMKTAGLPEEETTSSSDTEDSEAAPQDKTPDASFWDRVKNLFS